MRRVQSANFIQYWNTVWVFFGIALLSGATEPFFGYRAVGFLFLLGVLGVGFFGTIGPVLFGAFLSSIIWNFFFIPPRFTFAISQLDDFSMCIAYFIAAVTTGALTHRSRRHERMAREREERITFLFDILNAISDSKSRNEIIGRVSERVEVWLAGNCALTLLPQVGLFSFDSLTSITHNETLELNAAQFAFENGISSGRETLHFSSSEGLYIPILGFKHTMGVMAFCPNGERPLRNDSQETLEAVCHQLGLLLERLEIEDRLREADRLEESEKLHQTLLSSISHELRTPLTAIFGAATSLGDGSAPETREFRQAIAQELVQGCDRLNRVIGNLLDMTRLNAGTIAIRREWHDVHDLIGVVLGNIRKEVSRHEVIVSLSEHLPLIEIDFRLVEHALANIVLNAASYSPAKSKITISAESEATEILIQVVDEGPGIPEGEIHKIFEKFYRVKGTPTGGIGLGLSIVKSIVEFHKGTISARNQPGRGVAFTLALPRGNPPDLPREDYDKNENSCH